MTAEAVATIVLYMTLAGAMIPVGALLRYTEHLRRGHVRQDLLHAVVGFGGGARLR